MLADDQGSKEVALWAYTGWIETVDLLIGPYASGLVRAIAPLVRDAGRVLWNHGGSARQSSWLTGWPGLSWAASRWGGAVGRDRARSRRGGRGDRDCQPWSLIGLAISIPSA